MMRKAKIVAVLGVLALCTSALAEWSEPVSHWEFDEGSGAIAYDSAGNNHGTIYGATWTTGQIDGALSFDGDDDYVSIPEDPSLNFTLSSFTVSAWVNPHTKDQHIFTHYNRSSTRKAMHIKIFGDGRVKFAFYADDLNTDTGAIPYDSWSHVVCTYDYGSDTSNIYIDGVLNVTGSQGPYVGARVDSWIAKSWTGKQDFDGIIDGVCIYDRALSAEQVQQLYLAGFSAHKLAIIRIKDARAEKDEALGRIATALGKEGDAIEALDELLDSGDYGDLNKRDIVTATHDIHSAIQRQGRSRKVLMESIEKLEDALAALGVEPEPELDPNLVAHWKFDEGSGGTAADSSGNGNTGTLVGDTSWVAGRVGDYALDFDGTGDYVEIPDDASQQIATNQITLNAWVKLSQDVGNTQARIICKQETLGIAWGLEIFGDGYGGSSGNQVLFHDSDGGTSWYLCMSPTGLELDQWYHIAVTDNAGAIKIYINGVLDSSCNGGYGIPSSINSPIIIGSTVSEVAFFNGTIDDVRIYDRALSAEETWQLYQDGSDGHGKGKK